MTFTIPSNSQLLQAMLDNYRATSTYMGYNLTIDPGSEIYIRYAGIANAQSVLYNASALNVQSFLINSATGSALDTVANNFGLQRKAATAASGYVQLVSGVPITILAGQTLTGPNALTFKVSQSATYNTGVTNSNQVPVISVDLGSNTNIAAGSILTWSNVQPNMQSVAVVSTSITGGTDTESDANLRSRLYLTLQSPPQAGNNSQLSQLSASIDNNIQSAFVYSNFNGAGTQLIALVGYQTASYIGRDIPHLLTDGYTTQYGVSILQPGLDVQLSGYGPYNDNSLGVDNLANVYGPGAIGNPGNTLSNDSSIILGQLPGIVANPYATVITTVNNAFSTVAATLTLPYPIGSVPNGIGGGWQDITPWPVPDGYYVSNGYCKIVAVQGDGYSILGGNGSVGYGITVNAASSGLVHTTGNGNTNGMGGANGSLPQVSYQTYNAHVPVPGVTHINWIDRSDNNGNGWQIINATVLDALDNGNDTWDIILNTPLVYAPDGYDFYNHQAAGVNQLIFPAAINAQNYLNTFLQQFALLGPGQVTANNGFLLLGATRFPGPSSIFPNSLGVSLEKALVENYSEVFAASVNPGSVNANNQSSPYLASAYNTAFSPPVANAPPFIWIPGQIGWYPSESYGYSV